MFIKKSICNAIPQTPSVFDGDAGGDNKAFEELQAKFNEINSEVERLRNHNTTLLDEKKGVQQQLRELKKTFGDVDPDKFKEMMKVFDSSEEAKLIAEGKLDEVITKRTERTLLERDNQITELQKQIDDLTGNLTAANDKYSKKTINLELRTQAEKLGVLPSAIDDVIFRANGIFSLGENDSVEARDKDGNIRKVNGKELTPELFIKGLQDSAPHLWPASETGDVTGRRGNGEQVNPFVKGTPGYNITEQAKLRRADPELAASMKKEAENIAAKKQ